MIPVELALFDEVKAEMERALSLHGRQIDVPPPKWTLILGEEQGEVCKAILERDAKGYRKELIEVASTALRAVISFDSHPKESEHENPPTPG